MGTVSPLEGPEGSPVRTAWTRITAWLALHLPEVLTDLNPPASALEIRQTEAALGVSLPDDLKELYALANGQKEQSFGLFFGMQFLGLSRMASLHQSNLESDAVPSVPIGAIQNVRVHSAWVAFTADGLSQHCAIDFAPGETGHAGQVIFFGRIVQKNVVLATNFTTFLQWVALELDAGKGRVYEASGMRLFDHADVGDGNPEDGFAKILWAR